MNKRKFSLTLVFMAFLVLMSIGLTSCKKKLTKVEKVDATCLAEGRIEYWKDKKGNIYLDDKGKQKGTEADLVIPKVSLFLMGAVPPSADEPGRIEHYECPVCHKKYKTEVASPENELTDEEIIIPKLALEYFPAREATCVSYGSKEYWKDAEGNLYTDKYANIKTTAEGIRIAKVSLIHHDRVEPTIQATGNIEYWECPKCHKLYKSATPTIDDEITMEETVIPKLPELVVSIVEEPTTTAPGKVELTYAGATNQYDIHVLGNAHYTTEATKEPTNTSSGYGDYYLSSLSFVDELDANLTELIDNLHFKVVTDEIIFPTMARVILKDVFVIASAGTVLQLKVISGEIAVDDPLNIYHKGTAIQLNVLEIEMNKSKCTTVNQQQGVFSVRIGNYDKASFGIGDLGDNLDLPAPTATRVLATVGAKSDKSTPIFEALECFAYVGGLNICKVKIEDISSSSNLILPGEACVGNTCVFEFGLPVYVEDNIELVQGGKVIGLITIDEIL